METNMETIGTTAGQIWQYLEDKPERGSFWRQESYEIFQVSLAYKWHSKNLNSGTGTGVGGTSSKNLGKQINTTL